MESTDELTQHQRAVCARTGVTQQQYAAHATVQVASPTGAFSEVCTDFLPAIVVLLEGRTISTLHFATTEDGHLLLSILTDRGDVFVSELRSLVPAERRGDRPTFNALPPELVRATEKPVNPVCQLTAALEGGAKIVFRKNPLGYDDTVIDVGLDDHSVLRIRTQDIGALSIEEHQQLKSALGCC
jgi:hypothetical protein